MDWQILGSIGLVLVTFILIQLVRAQAVKDENVEKLSQNRPVYNPFILEKKRNKL